MQLLIIFMVLILSSSCATNSTSKPLAPWADLDLMNFDSAVAEIHAQNKGNDELLMEYLLPIDAGLYALANSNKEVGIPLDSIVESRKMYFDSLIKNEYRYYTYARIKDYNKSIEGFNMESAGAVFTNPDTLFLKKCFNSGGCRTYVPKDFGITKIILTMDIDDLYLPVKPAEARKYIFGARYLNSDSKGKNYVRVPAMFTFSVKECSFQSKGFSEHVANCDIKLNKVYIYGQLNVNKYDIPVNVLRPKP